MSRKIAISYIQNALDILNDNYIISIYEKTCEHTGIEVDEIPKRHRMIEYINKNLGKIEDDELFKIQKEINDFDDQDKHEEKLIVILLNVLNCVLETFENDVGKLSNIIEFKNINKKYLVTDEVRDAVKAKYEYIFKDGFDKKKCQYYTSKNKPNSHLTILRGMCKQINYKIVSKQKMKMIKGEKHYESYYSIVKNIE